MSAREARKHFAELTDRVRYTGEPVVVEKQGQPFVAVVSLDDLEAVRRLRIRERQEQFTHLAARAASEQPGGELTDEEIVDKLKETRENLYRQRYG